MIKFLRSWLRIAERSQTTLLSKWKIEIMTKKEYEDKIIYSKTKLVNEKALVEAAKKDPEAFILLAKTRGYAFTVKDLETQLSQLSDEDVAGIFNPGIGQRRHLFPK